MTFEFFFPDAYLLSQPAPSLTQVTNLYRTRPLWRLSKTPEPPM